MSKSTEFLGQNSEKCQKVAILGRIGDRLLERPWNDIPYLLHGVNKNGHYILENSVTGAVCLAMDIAPWEDYNG